MNTDIRVSVSFRGHRKRKKLQRLLGAEAVLCLIDLWIVAAMSRPDGVLDGMDAEDIALDAGWDGEAQEFVDALVQVGFLDELAGGGYALHDWDDHNSYASSVDDRSDKARFSRMRQAYPELYARLYKAGMRAISKEEYGKEVAGYLDGASGVDNAPPANIGDAVATPQRRHGEQSAEAEQRNGDATANAGAALAPSPSPSPSPSQKNKNTLCDGGGCSAGFATAPAGAGGTAPGHRDFGRKNSVEWFNRFWDAFGDKRGKQPAWKAWGKIKGLDAAIVVRIVAAAELYALQRPGIIDRGGTPKMAEGWLSDRRWEDEQVDPAVSDGQAMDPSLRRAFDRVIGGNNEHAAA